LQLQPIATKLPLTNNLNINAMRNKVLVTILLLIANYSLFAQCNCQSAIKIANLCAGKVVQEAWHGGNQITTSVKSCNYNCNTGKWTFNVIIEFNGEFSGNYYRTDGLLEYNECTAEFNDSASYKNQRLKDYEAFIRLIYTEDIVYQLTQE